MAADKVKTRYSDNELEEFDKLLDEKLSMAHEQLSFYMEQIQELSENDDSKLKGLETKVPTMRTTD